MRNKHTITVIGIIWLLLWLSHTANLFPTPFQNKGLEEFSKEIAAIPDFIKEIAGMEGLTNEAIQKNFIKGIQFLWFQSLFIIIVGCTSGILIIMRKNIGRILALGLTSIILSYRIFNFFSSDHWRERLSMERFITFYSKFHEYLPLRALHDGITLLILIVTSLLLLHPSIARNFKKSIKQ